jgi:hypothetical protein
LPSAQADVPPAESTGTPRLAAQRRGAPGFRSKAGLRDLSGYGGSAGIDQHKA